MATLNVHEAMGMKVDREAVAGLVLPQLWMMSMGPCKSPIQDLTSTNRLAVLSVDQFNKFMRSVAAIPVVRC
jgi:SCY1-like protein 2